LGSKVHLQCMRGIWWTDGHTQFREMALKINLRCGTWEQSPPRGLGRDLTSTLTDIRPPCFEVEKHALRLGASAHYLLESVLFIGTEFSLLYNSVYPPAGAACQQIGGPPP